MIKLVTTTALCIFAMFSSPATANEYQTVFNELDRTVREKFYDPHFGGRDWAEIAARYRSQLDRVTTDAEFQKLGQAMLNELGVSHVVVHLPEENRPTMGLAARWEMIDDVPVIVDIDPASGARGAGLRIGDRILNPSVIRGPRQEPAVLEVERCDTTTESLSIPRESAYWPPRERTISWSVLRRGDGRSVGYIRADRFGDDAAELIDAAMETVGKTDGLIIDIRNNSGGNASALRLLGYFTSPGPGVALLSRPFLETLDGPVEANDLAPIHRVSRAYTTEAVFDAVSQGKGAVMLMIEDLGERRYDKPVTILIGPETGSAAEGFAWGAKEQSSAILIGRNTAGALLSSERLDLPNGWRVTLPVHGNWGPDGRDYGDQPVPPHVATILTREAICRNEDADLTAAIEALEEAWLSASLGK
ncbi:S41 family peptidase [Parasphingorhabdus sp.]|uniref:S41 family peptidase n=1 Tax=Parasphingorhabdus sp. TaxID=2709688 RepID=UPI0035936567